MTEPITILIVDDHEVVRKGVRSYLETLPDFRW
jgi:DNA-binding NarL/FixJ family response regulator